MVNENVFIQLNLSAKPLYLMFCAVGSVYHRNLFVS